MIFLSDSAIQYAVGICRERERYKVVIATTKESRDIAVEKLLLLTKNANDVRIINSSSDFEIMFDNGSLIRLIPAKESSRGHKAHLLVVDEDISRTTIQNVLKPCEVMDWSEYLRKHRRDEE